MLVSILHRVSGDGLAIVGGVLLTWWLAAAASGKESYDWFTGLFTYETGSLNIVGFILFIGLTWAFFQHLLSGIRHLVLDTGAGYELKANKTWATLIPLFAIMLTGIFWIIILARGIA